MLIRLTGQVRSPIPSRFSGGMRPGGAGRADYQRAHELALKAAELGTGLPARWLAAAALRRAKELTRRLPPEAGRPAGFAVLDGEGSPVVTWAEVDEPAGSPVRFGLMQESDPLGLAADARTAAHRRGQTGAAAVAGARPQRGSDRPVASGLECRRDAHETNLRLW